MTIRNKKQIASMMILITVLILGVSFPAVSYAQRGDNNNFIVSKKEYTDGLSCVSGQVIIVYEDTVSANAYAESERQLKDKIVNAHDDILTPIIVDVVDNSVIVQLNCEIEISDYIDSIQNQPGVLYAQPNFIYTISAEANDPIANDNSTEAGWHLHTVNAFEAWDYTMGSNDIVIGIVDTGVDIDHPDLQDNIIRHWDTADDDGSADEGAGDYHGTMVSGLAAAIADNNQGSCGIAPNCSLIVVDAFYDSLNCTTTDLTEAIDYLIEQGVDVINLSVNGYGEDTLLSDKISEAYDAGIVVVAAAGNANTDRESHPSDHPDVISVMASTIDDDYLWASSNFGDVKDISAPGHLMASTYSGGTYSSGSGTSYASPLITGTVALMLSIDSTLTPDEVKEILYLTADDTATQKYDGADEYGAGRLNSSAAVAEVFARLEIINPRTGDVWLFNDGILKYVLVVLLTVLICYIGTIVNRNLKI